MSFPANMKSLDFKRLPIKILSLSLILFLASCSPRVKESLPYFENIRTSQSGSLGKSDFKIRLVPQDELIITVNSANPMATMDYNLPLINPALRNGKQEMKLTGSAEQQQQTYIVNSKGDITFPKLGKIHVQGMTVEELTDYLTSRISEEVKDPIVRVTLANFKVNVMGEVTSPQAVKVTSERFSVLDALAGAGDMTQYGIRDNVLVIRENPDGEKIYRRLNLQDANVINDPYFYLQQNDVVYVEPNAVKKINSKFDQNKSYRIQVISTVVSASSVIASLIISLTVK